MKHVQVKWNILHFKSHDLTKLWMCLFSEIGSKDVVLRFEPPHESKLIYVKITGYPLQMAQFGEVSVTDS